MRTLIQFAAILSTALALVPGGAHLLALPNKIALVRDDYFIVQSIYRGWALLGVILIAAVLFDLLAGVVARHRRLARALALTAAIIMAATLVVFFVWTYPANVATDNWTSVPDNWRALRTQWEYSHAANAVLTVMALSCIIGSALVDRAATAR